ncbi:MAG: hypothetical protein IPK93_03960 [Solirubrobacterales bacterium]|nr:hypothetical protein [Solirubrobacterales bacterium]
MSSQITLNGETVTDAASPAEAAAISAAISRFQADTAVAPPPASGGMDPWLKAALDEGVGAKSLFGPGGTDQPF